MISETCHVRPSDILDPLDELHYIDKIKLDSAILMIRGKEASKTISPQEAEEYMITLKDRMK
ncbi:MAG: hypothetical protein GPJ50_03420 [Candidatus Heimdallarchaeota archaeon]|nr:hypothetical protein [Candidatus Heimdallarchaeota archaeon]